MDYAPHVISLDNSNAGEYPLIFMTGHYDFEFTEKEIEELRRFLNKGGILVASAAAGLKPFDTAFRREIKRVLPQSDLIKLPPSHPIFAMGWNRIFEVEYAPAALRDNPNLQYPEFYAIFIDNRIAVLYTPYDFKSSLNREANAYNKGLIPDDALRVALNIITYAISH